MVTHTPPRTHCDQPDGQRSAGCEALRQALWRVRPKLAVCGHVHDGRGAERVVWDLNNVSKPYAERAAMAWEDPGAGNNKLSLIDLTGKSGKLPALANDGSHPGRPSYQDDQQTASTPALAGPQSGESSQHGSSVAAQKRGGGDGDDGPMGYGGDPESEDCDSEALAGRQGRKETCVVNAAIMKGSYPHVGGKQFGKPIVVDLYLPVWED